MQKGFKFQEPHTHNVLRGTKLPFVSCNVDETGAQRLVTRPPFSEAILQYFERRKYHHAMLHMGKRIVLADQECALSTPAHFLHADRGAAAETVTSFGTWDTDKKWWAGSAKKVEVSGHGTSVDNGFEIAQDAGLMVTSREKCGRGTRFSAAPHGVSEELVLEELWNKTRPYYNRGWLVVAEMQGQCVKTHKTATNETPVPAGTFARKDKCQEFSAHPRCVNIRYIVFVVDGLVGKLRH